LTNICVVFLSCRVF